MKPITTKDEYKQAAKRLESLTDLEFPSVIDEQEINELSRLIEEYDDKFNPIN